MNPVGTDNFIHLHCHTEYSLLDGASRIKEVIGRAKELGMDSLAITDHGVMYGIIDFYKEAVSQGIKPIIGCEVYVAPGSMDIKEGSGDGVYSHLVLLAQDGQGYKNLVKLVSLGFTRGFYYKPRVDIEALKMHHNGIIALSACLAGDIPKLLLQQQHKEAAKRAQLYNNIFGQGNFYLELQDHGLREQKFVNQGLVELGEQLGIPLVATNDVHYVRKEDAQAHDVLMCIQTGKRVNDQDRMKMSTSEFYLKSAREMAALFEHVPDAMENTVDIAQRCNVEFSFNKLYMPKYQVPSGYDPAEYLRKLCCDGIKERFGEASGKDITERVDYELNLIQRMGYVDYFLIVWDFIKYAKDHGIMVGPGRGSAAGSLVAYCLGITEIDPLKYNLLFERFLNPDRITMPDIDIDFCFERRGEVIDYVVEKYGADRVAQIITFGTMAARAVIRDVGRALDMPYNEVDRVAKLIPFELGMTLKRALELNPQLKEGYMSDHQIKQLIDMSLKLEGLPRHASTHAAGVVISKEPLTEYVPLQRNDDIITTQFSMGVLEELGLLKMDFLGLRTLTVIRDTLQLIKHNRGIEIDINTIDFNDPKVYDMITQGETEGVFQLESPGMRAFLKELKPSRFEDIIAGISLYRPGPMDQIPRYIANKNNPRNITYHHQKLEPILNVTYGCMVYQEQVMQIVRDLAGYSLGRADLVRRAMAKKKTDVMEKERQNFIHGIVGEDGEVEVPGAVNNGIPPSVASRIFDEMMEFAKYAFNKSHAAAYAVIAYRTAWLKCHYPVEFMAALMTSFMGNTGKIAAYINNCNRMGIRVLPPDVNESYENFTVIGDTIRFGMAAVKNVGHGAISTIIKTRNEKGRFASFTEFCQKTALSDINKKTVESLIKCGAFDSLLVKRSQLLAVFDKIMDSQLHSQKNNIAGQVSLFESVMEKSTVDKINRDILPDIEEFPQRTLLAMEKEMVGIYMSGHPLMEYKGIIEDIASTSTLEINNLQDQYKSEGDISINRPSLGDGDRVVIGGIVTSKKVKATKNSKMMAFVTLEDLHGTIEIIVFPVIYEKLMNLLNEDNVLIVKGRLSLREDQEPKVICEDAYSVEGHTGKKLYLKIARDKDIDIKGQLSPLLSRYRGNIPVYVYFEAADKKLMVSKAYWVKDNEHLLDDLRRLLGRDCVKITG